MVPNHHIISEDELRSILDSHRAPTRGQHCKNVLEYITSQLETNGTTLSKAAIDLLYDTFCPEPELKPAKLLPGEVTGLHKALRTEIGKELQGLYQRAGVLPNPRLEALLVVLDKGVGS